MTLLGLTADHDEDGDGDEAEGDPDTNESTEDGSDTELDWTGVDVNSALRVLRGESLEGEVVPVGGPHVIEGPHGGRVLSSWLQASHAPVSGLCRYIPRQGVVLRPPHLEDEGHADRIRGLQGLAVHRDRCYSVVGDLAGGDKERWGSGHQLEHAGATLPPEGVLGPTEEAPVVHLCSGDVIHDASRPVDPHLVLLDVDHLLAGVEHPVEGQLGLGVGLHLAEDLHLGVEAHLELPGAVGGADRLV